MTLVALLLGGAVAHAEEPQPWGIAPIEYAQDGTVEPASFQPIDTVVDQPIFGMWVVASWCPASRLTFEQWARSPDERDVAPIMAVLQNETRDGATGPTLPPIVMSDPTALGAPAGMVHAIPAVFAETITKYPTLLRCSERACVPAAVTQSLPTLTSRDRRNAGIEPLETLDDARFAMQHQDVAAWVRGQLSEEGVEALRRMSDARRAREALAVALYDAVHGRPKSRLKYASPVGNGAVRPSKVMGTFPQTAYPDARKVVHNALTPKKRVKPVYPGLEPRQVRDQYCAIRVVVDPKGKASEALAAPTCQPRFQQSARTALAKWRWKPTGYDDVVATTIFVTFRVPQ